VTSEAPNASRPAALVALAAGAAAFALYARITSPWHALGWVVLVPWLAVLDRTGSTAQALRAGALMSILLSVSAFGWFASAIRTYTNVPWIVGLAVLLLLGPFLQPQLVVFAGVRRLVQARGGPFWRTTLAGAGVWVGVEWLVPKLFGDTLGYGLYPSVWMRQAADLSGVGALTFVLVVANECAGAALTALLRRAPLRRTLAPAAAATVLATGLAAYGAIRCAQVDADRGGTPVAAAIVQADIGQYDRLRAERGTFETVRLILDTHFALSREALGRGNVDLLVWPETVYPTTFGTPKSADGAAFDRTIAAFVAGSAVPLVFGSYDTDGADEFNAAVFLEPARQGPLAFETYRKTSLFPLTERVPPILDWAVVRRWLPWLGTWKPGGGARAVGVRLRDGRTLRIAPLICYDALEAKHALGAVRDGAELIVTLSNDSWFTVGNAAWLHLVGAAFRSVETRRPQLRATNTGISAVITPTGDLAETADVHERRALVGSVRPEGAASTLILAWGDWFAPTALAAALALVAAPGRRRRPAGCPRVPVRSSRIMDGPRFNAPTRTERLFNRLFGALVGLGIGLPHNFLLEVRGRRTGRTFATPVDVLAHDGRRFLVAARGETQWVRNARASGRVVLRKGLRREELRLRAVPDRDKPVLLKAYLDRFKLTVQRYFPVPAGSPAEDLAPLAGRYPVFELLPPEPPRS
jgi:apolipoprotein N-acyltransferase